MEQILRILFFTFYFPPDLSAGSFRARALVNALKKCDNDPYVVTAVARLFNKDRKFPKARKWFERAVVLDPKVGDSWIFFYCFELCQQAEGSGTIGAVEDVLKRCVLAEPNKGEIWCRIGKQTQLRRAGPAKILQETASDVLCVMKQEK